MAWWGVLAAAVAIGAGWPAGPARANGNYSHVWVARDAVRYVPPGDLQDLLNRPGIVDIVRNGAMYPDGGYAINDGYGEISHWEPFHKVYLEWIRKTYSPPWSDEAAKHIAFLLGMVAHGLTDQFDDGMYLERHAAFDPFIGDAPYGLDGATDSCFAATQGNMDLPESWVPADVLAPLYDQLGHHVEADTIQQGFQLVAFAVIHANVEGADPATIASLRAFYPWACDHQADPTVPGSPVTCGPGIAAYWQVLWQRLQRLDTDPEVFEPPLLATFFSGGAPWDYPRDSTSPDSWVSFAMPRGLLPSTVDSTTVVVTADGGDAHPATVQVYYGLNSHLVNVKPQGDWAADTSYTVTVSPPIQSWDKVPFGAAVSFPFSTKPAPAVEPVPEVAEVAEVVEVVEVVPDVAEVAEPPPDFVEVPDMMAALPDVAEEIGVSEPVPDAGAVSGKSGGCSATTGATPHLATTLLALVFFVAFLAGLRGRGFPASAVSVRRSGS